MFRINWVHLGLFGCVTTLSVKRVKLVKKFVPWSPIGIFCNEHTQSTPLDPKLMFWSFFYFLGAFWIVWLPYKTRCNTGQNWCKSSCHEVASEFFATKAPDPPHWTLNSHFGAFRTIRVHFGPFGCLTTLSAKRVKLVQKFVPQSRVGIFHNEHTRSTPLDSKLLFSWFLNYLGAFGTVWLPSNTQCKTGQTGAKVRARSRVGIFRNERTRSTTLDPKLVFWCVPD